MLTGYQLLPLLLKELVIDQAIGSISLSPEEEAVALEQFYQQQHLQAQTQRQEWLDYHRMSSEQLTQQAHRQLKLHKFKVQHWQHQIESDFLQQKGQFDQYLYSLIRVTNAEVALELYFRLQAGEQSFAELAQQYSQGPEAQAGGLVGPVLANALHPTLAQLLTTLQPGQVEPPIPLGDWYVLVTLQHRISAQLNNSLRHTLLDRRFNAWMQDQIQRLSVSDHAISVSIQLP
ncbi:MAG: peptidylprolyl isomerase [Acaryochloridaceae cyanobacterium SU_2_1]|nr:peptidylprolyl isomerase [Acaryochloridaceae cyanobacterium SU_2_1]